MACNGKISNNRRKRTGKAGKKAVLIPLSTQLRLWVRAGGRCEFLGCNEYLLRDDLTLSEANYSEIAHIVAASPGWARGDDPLPAGERSEIENLMLLCRKHHKLVDDRKQAKLYPKRKLLEFKRLHEERIETLTSIKPGNKTSMVRLRSNIASDSISIPKDQIYAAIYPRYPEDEKGLEIDLTKLPGSDSTSYWKAGAECIRSMTKRFLAPGIGAEAPEHISVFALAPIPFLVLLGCCLGSKVPTDVYQRHWDTQDWLWKKQGYPCKYKVLTRRRSASTSKVALVLSLSGRILNTDLPPAVSRVSNVYEITLDGKKPSPTCVRTKRDLAGFGACIQSFLRGIRQSHPGLKEIMLFPAVPVSVAVLCGMARLPKVDPSFVVYDFNSAKGKFYRTLKAR